MHTIKQILDACATIKPNATPVQVNRLLMPLAHEFCKYHPHTDELILIVKVKDLKPLLYSHSYNFSITNLHQAVDSAVKKARKQQTSDIIILEWLTSKQVKLPYFQNFAFPLACHSPHNSNF